MLPFSEHAFVLFRGQSVFTLDSLGSKELRLGIVWTCVDNVFQDGRHSIHPRFIAEPGQPGGDRLSITWETTRTREGFLLLGAVFTRPPSCRPSPDIRAGTVGSFCVNFLTPVFRYQALPRSNGELFWPGMERTIQSLGGG